MPPDKQRTTVTTPELDPIEVAVLTAMAVSPKTVTAARALGVSARTVRRARLRAQDRLGAVSAIHAVALAAARGLISLSDLETRDIPVPVRVRRSSAVPGDRSIRPDVVDAALLGHVVPLTVGEREEIVRRLHARGRTDAQMAPHLDVVHPPSVGAIRRRLGLPLHKKPKPTQQRGHRYGRG